MFQIQDVVVYGAQGVCRIVGIDEQKSGGITKQYFVLKPHNDTGATFYVPMGNEKALAKMRKVMTVQEVNALIDSMPNQSHVWIDNPNERKDACRRILISGDHAALLSMLQALYLHKKARESEGKRLHMADEYFMKEAEQLLYHEWQYVLHMDKDELMTYIFSRIKQTS